MNTITTPISFNSITIMNKFYAEFEQQAIKICTKYSVLGLWADAKILKDDENLLLAIVSLGTYAKGSNKERAANEIIDTFNKMF